MRRLRRGWGRVAPVVGLLVFATALFTCGFGVQRTVASDGLRRAEWAGLALGFATVASGWALLGPSGVARRARR